MVNRWLLRRSLWGDIKKLLSDVGKECAGNEKRCTPLAIRKNKVKTVFKANEI